MEQWKNLDSPNCEVSSNGNVRVRRANGSWRVTTGHISGPGYYVIMINRKNYYVHRLVAMAFKGDPANTRMVVNHLNGIKTDNRETNIEWCTEGQNHEHAYKTGLRRRIGENHHFNTGITKDQVLQVYQWKKEGKKLRDISKLVTWNYGTLKCIFRGENWSHEYKLFFGEAGKSIPTIGANQWRALPESTVLRIYELKKMGKRAFEVAKEMGMSFSTVNSIYRGKNWKHFYKEHFGK